MSSSGVPSYTELTHTQDNYGSYRLRQINTLPLSPTNNGLLAGANPGFRCSGIITKCLFSSEELYLNYLYKKK